MTKIADDPDAAPHKELVRRKVAVKEMRRWAAASKRDFVRDEHGRFAESGAGGMAPEGGSVFGMAPGERSPEEAQMMEALEGGLNLGGNREVMGAVLERGVSYPPPKSGELPADIRPGQAKMCYNNAFMTAAASDGKYVYVEGYAADPNFGLPVQHAWVVDGDGSVYDPTWSEANGIPPGSAYVGVEVDANTAIQHWDMESGEAKSDTPLTSLERGIIEEA